MKGKKKTSKDRPEFILSNDAKEHRAEFARMADAKIVLAHSCSQTKLEVLQHQINKPEVLDWLSKRLDIMMKIHKNKYGDIPVDGSYDEKDDKQELLIDISTKTIPERIQSGQWNYYLNAYIGKAINGFLTNYFRKHESKGGKEKRNLKDMLYPDRAMAQDEKNQGSFFDRLINDYNPADDLTTEDFRIKLMNALTKRQAQIVILLSEEKTYEDAATEIGCSIKTIQRERQAILNNKKIRKLLSI